MTHRDRLLLRFAEYAIRSRLAEWCPAGGAFTGARVTLGEDYVSVRAAINGGAGHWVGEGTTLAEAMLSATVVVDDATEAP